MALYTTLFGFGVTHPGPVNVILDTSFVFENASDIDKLASLRHTSLSVGESTEAELKLLASYGIRKDTSDNAKKILSLCRVCPDPDTLYKENARNAVRRFSFRPGENYVFVFYNTAKAEEFLEHTKGLLPDAAYVFIHDVLKTSLAFTDNVFCPRSAVGADRKCVRLRSPADLGLRLLERDTDPGTFAVKDEKGCSVNGFDLTKAERLHVLGGEADLYAVERGGIKYVLKVYKKFSIGEGFERKLKYLIRLGKNLRAPTVAFPLFLLYGENECRGFIMPYIAGSSILTAKTFPAEKKKDVYRRLTALIVELGLYGVALADLSPNNVLISPDGKVILVDIDSCEAAFFPGGGLTPYCFHPDLPAKVVYKDFRESNTFTFSFALMLFRLEIGFNNPLSQIGVEEEVWHREQFPYTFDGNEAPGCRVNPKALSLWRSLPAPLRRIFCDTFSFRYTHSSIGAFVKALEI